MPKETVMPMEILELLVPGDFEEFDNMVDVPDDAIGWPSGGCYLEDTPHEEHTCYDEMDLDELCESIAERGLIQPLEVKTLMDGRLRLWNGHHRYAAARRLGLTEVPVLIYAQLEDYQS